jgi:hypothetical protein
MINEVIVSGLLARLWIIGAGWHAVSLETKQLPG